MTNNKGIIPMLHYSGYTTGSPQKLRLYLPTRDDVVGMGDEEHLTPFLYCYYGGTDRKDSIKYDRKVRRNVGT